MSYEEYIDEYNRQQDAAKGGAPPADEHKYMAHWGPSMESYGYVTVIMIMCVFESYCVIELLSYYLLSYDLLRYDPLSFYPVSDYDDSYGKMCATQRQQLTWFTGWGQHIEAYG
jgi:hypothetical protein